MHEIMGNTLGSLYTCPRGLLRRRRWKLGVTVRNFFMIKFPEFLGSPTYKQYNGNHEYNTIHMKRERHAINKIKDRLKINNAIISKADK
jgi:hypothetical protein